MSLAVKDANSNVQQLSTANDASGNLVPVHAPASTVGGVATPVSPAAPLPVVNAAGAAAVDGSGTVTVGGSSQVLFGGAVPATGFMIANNSSALIYVSDVGLATAGGASIPVAVNGVFFTPSGYRPAGPVSLYGASTGQAFAARRW